MGHGQSGIGSASWPKSVPRGRRPAALGVNQGHRKEGRAMKAIRPFLWFDNQAEEAAKFYISIFKNSKIGTITRYGDTGPGPKGFVMTIEFELEGQNFIALNGGPVFKFNEAISFSVDCQTQEEVDELWEKL